MANKMSIAKTLRKHGVLGVLKTYTTGGGAYNPETGKIDSRGSQSDDSTRAMVLLDQMTKTPSRSYGSSGVTQEINTLVEGVQKWALVDATGREPKMQDHVLVSGTEWHVLNVQSVVDKGVDVMYILALRR